MLSLVEKKFVLKNPLQDLLSSLNAVISINESTRFITGHVINNSDYTYKFQPKTTKEKMNYIEAQEKALKKMHIEHNLRKEELMNTLRDFQVQ